MNNWTNDDIKFVEKAVELRNKGFYIDSTQLTNAYNRILGKHVANTSCGSCIRQRITELEAALNQYKAKKAQDEAISSPSDSVLEVEVDNSKVDENKAVRKAGNRKK